jgi:hypothetical protein
LSSVVRVLGALGAFALSSLTGLSLDALSGCGASPAPPGAAVVTVATPSIPDAPRQPDGVVLEPAAAVPEAEDRGEAGGVVSLRAPLPVEAVTTVVHRLFRAFGHEDVDGLQAILTDGAVVLGNGAGATNASRAGHPGAPEGSLLDLWRTRLKNPAYARLATLGVDLVEPDAIARFGYEDLGSPGAPERPSGMKPGDLLVRFAIAMPRVGTERLFGDAMTLPLRREGRTYKIAAAAEENAP